jgi:hypothetical protein
LAPNDTRVFQGVDAVVTGKFGDGGTVTGGVTMGRTALDRCTVSDPNLLRFCNYTPSFFANNQYKAIFSYPLHYDVQISGVLTSNPFVPVGQSMPVYNNGGPDLTPSPYLAANYTVTSAIAGIPLTNGSIPVNLATPGAEVGQRYTRLDLRIAKTVSVRQSRLHPYVDLFNVFNVSSVITPNQTYGPQYLAPAAIVPGRTLRIGMDVSF